MTVCIGAICDKGNSIIISSDGMITSRMPPIEFETKNKKISELSNKCLVLTAGDALAHVELFSKVKKECENQCNDTNFFVSKIKESYKFLRERAIRERILNKNGFEDFDVFFQKQQVLNKEIVFGIQREISNFNYGLDILLCGVDEKAHIFTITNPGTSFCYDSLGFVSIGSGYFHAFNTMIARECHPQKSVQEMLLIVYEAKKRAEITPGVGSGVTDLSIITKDGIKHFPRELINEDISRLYKMWVEFDTKWETQLIELINKIPLVGGDKK